VPRPRGLTASRHPQNKIKLSGRLSGKRRFARACRALYGCLSVLVFWLVRPSTWGYRTCRLFMVRRRSRVRSRKGVLAHKPGRRRLTCANTVGRRLRVLRLATAETGSLRLAVPHTCPSLKPSFAGLLGPVFLGARRDRSGRPQTRRSPQPRFYPFSCVGSRSVIARVGRNLSRICGEADAEGALDLDFRSFPVAPPPPGTRQDQPLQTAHGEPQMPSAVPVTQRRIGRPSKRTSARMSAAPLTAIHHPGRPVSITLTMDSA
jgi:hypothetical protein